MTMIQLLNLAGGKPPGVGGELETIEDYEAVRLARIAADEEWGARN